MTVDAYSPATPRVSVLMTIYNAEPFLRESIDSLIAQSFSHWELIAVENGSTDKSPSILAGYADPRIRVFSFSKNIGRTPALRHAFNQARSEYIAILDADDLAHPQRLAREVAFLDRHPETVLVGSWAQHIDRAGRVFNTWEPPTDSDALHDCLGWRDPIVNSSAMYRRMAALAVGGYPEQYSYSQDFALILALVQHGRLAVIGEHLCKFRILSGGMTRANQYRMDLAREGLLLYRQAGEILPLSSKARRMNRCALAKYEIRYGLAILKSGNIFLGFRKIACALWHAPEVLWINQLFRTPFQTF